MFNINILEIFAESQRDNNITTCETHYLAISTNAIVVAPFTYTAYYDDRKTVIFMFIPYVMFHFTINCYKILLDKITFAFSSNATITKSGEVEA